MSASLGGRARSEGAWPKAALSWLDGAAKKEVCGNERVEELRGPCAGGRAKWFGARSSARAAAV
jgi:hypothetical protein